MKDFDRFIQKRAVKIMWIAVDKVWIELAVGSWQLPAAITQRLRFYFVLRNNSICLAPKNFFIERKQTHKGDII